MKKETKFERKSVEKTVKHATKSIDTALIDMYRFTAENDKSDVLKSKHGKLSLDDQYNNALIARRGAHNERELIHAENLIARLEKLIANRYSKDFALRLVNEIAKFANNMPFDDKTYSKSLFELVPIEKWTVWAGVQSLIPVAGYAGINTGYLSVAEAEIYNADDFIRTACKNTHGIKRVDDMIHFRRLRNKGKEHIDIIRYMKEYKARIDKKRIN